MQSAFTQQQLSNMPIDRLLAFAVPETPLEHALIESMLELQTDAKRVEELEGDYDGTKDEINSLERQLSNVSDQLDDYKDFYNAIYSAFVQGEGGWDASDGPADTDMLRAIEEVIKLGIDAQADATT